MKGIYMTLAMIAISFTSQAMIPSSCALNAQPQLVKPIADWDIIANNIAVIKTAPYFSGPHLGYAVSHKAINPKNTVSIDSGTGEITINAQASDNFDLHVTATNSCGSVTSTFNVQIDEDA